MDMGIGNFGGELHRVAHKVFKRYAGEPWIGVGIQLLLNVEGQITASILLLQIGGNGFRQPAHAEVLAYDFGAGNTRKLEQRIDELTHALHSAADSLDVIPASVVDVGGEVLLKSQAEPIN